MAIWLLHMPPPIRTTYRRPRGWVECGGERERITCPFRFRLRQDALRVIVPAFGT